MRLALVVAAIGCSEPAPAQPPPSRVDASALLAKYECNRCHELPGLPPAPRDKHCFACHQQVHAGTFPARPELIAEWRQRVADLRWAPSLVGAGRFRRAWLRDFLLEPHDLRPGLFAEMPRLALTPDDAARIAAHLAPDDPTDPADAGPLPDEVARGEQLYRALGCARCHLFTGAAIDDPALHELALDETGRHPTAAWALAPDLRYARDRSPVHQLAAWIAAPRGAMPMLGILPGDARSLAAFIATAPLAPVPPRAPVARPPPLARAVTWDEVEGRVFRRVCWHCHAVPDYARGDGGPGNSGGFGFAPRGLDLSSYAGISAGALDDAGEPRSVFARLPDGTPLLVAALLARHAEEAGHPVPGLRGMPLGLPPLSLHDIQLVDTWIAQGRPQ